MRARANGFTLLELLVAMSLMAIIAGSLYGSLYVAFKGHKSATAAIEPARTAALALDLLRQDFEAVPPPNGVFKGEFIGTDNSGTNSDLMHLYSCANVPRESEVASDFRMVQFSVDTADDGQPALIRTVTTNLMASNDTATRDQIICRRVQWFNVRYYDGTQWLDYWDSAGAGDLLPLAIEVTLEISPNPDRPGASQKNYRIARVFRLLCGQMQGVS